MNEPIFKNLSLESLEDNITSQKPVLFITKEEHGVVRSLNLSKEFGLNPWILSNGYEYRRLIEIKDHKPIGY